MSSDLQWLLLRKSNSFFVKRVPEGPVFSRESGNLTNLHSFKYSGLANQKTIDISESGNGIKITTRKQGASPIAVRKGLASSTIRNRSGGRRAAGIVSKLAKRGYRPDLRTAALARASAILASHQEKKPAPPKKVRGSKVVKA
ncbi:hypothetical protein EW026_g1459 [Hermanssonia centrifuga]|uniref:Ribosomal eL28/Mak16 domain-containing protein n=1 Tax=Hermanssonia centrifuga TaxID=98765 RepID=A0A4S4KRE7_9APHY|nr:hypothetical protein EW026_g1459 [Hermanssonia centrifuga]